MRKVRSDRGVPRTRQMEAKEYALRWFAGLSKVEQTRALEDLALVQWTQDQPHTVDLLPEWDVKTGTSTSISGQNALNEWAQHLAPEADGAQ